MDIDKYSKTLVATYNLLVRTKIRYHRCGLLSFAMDT
jgi:hypothetical protein